MKHTPMILSRSTPSRIASTLLGIAVISMLLSCGDPKYQPPAVAIKFDPNFPPPASLETGAHAGIAAVVTNGGNNSTVDFTCTPAGQCGTFSPASAGSSVPVCYLAPAQAPTGNTVTVIATAAADTTKSVSAIITIVNGAPNPCP